MFNYHCLQFCKYWLQIMKKPRTTFNISQKRRKTTFLYVEHKSPIRLNNTSLNRFDALKILHFYEKGRATWALNILCSHVFLRFYCTQFNKMIYFYIFLRKARFSLLSSYRNFFFFLKKKIYYCATYVLSLIHIWRCRRYAVCRSRWSPYH